MKSFDSVDYLHSLFYCFGDAGVIELSKIVEFCFPCLSNKQVSWSCPMTWTFSWFLQLSCHMCPIIHYFHWGTFFLLKALHLCPLLWTTFSNLSLSEASFCWPSWRTLYVKSFISSSFLIWKEILVPFPFIFPFSKEASLYGNRWNWWTPQKLLARHQHCHISVTWSQN